MNESPVLVPGARRRAFDVRSAAVTAVLPVVIAALLVVALAVGEYPLTVLDVLGALMGTTDGLAPTVVLDWRLPRAAAAVAFGAALGVAGAIFQTVARNPLASPDVIGLAHGSFTGMIVALLFLGGSWPLLIGGSLLGGVVTALAVAVLTARDGFQSFRFIVIGIGVSAMLAAVNSWLLLRAELETALFAAAWGAGSLNTVSADTAWPAIVCIAVLLLAVPVVSRSMRQLELGDDVARSTGVSVGRVRIVLIGIAVALVSVVTAIAGPVAFIALSAPQIARRLVGSAGIPLVASALTGGMLLLGADIVAQHVIPLTVPVGVVTVVVGGGYLVWLLAREMRRAS
ncbi:iron chelate uptake ABC transporter family permease subunit [Microbacterium betulae]|uniref:Iron chelate uptake ABC transporter family permease subunit n=1 Tax=Microbacterium betulae TaxID=2981139 RepID=A0AA97FJ96_9MICO|nr:iron chelate uptake ABC transporter family permease subunit [Microbacterium sp. AB]WOF24070.1 iron chelate uptake ABC transporter family permease subunit [Microbacterium sp. AB]